jgi:hypothetical protein
VFRQYTLKKHEHKDVDGEIEQHAGVDPKQRLLFDMHKLLPCKQLVEIQQRKTRDQNT